MASKPLKVWRTFVLGIDIQLLTEQNGMLLWCWQHQQVLGYYNTFLGERKKTSEEHLTYLIC